MRGFKEDNMNELMKVFLEYKADEDGYDRWSLLEDFLTELNTQLTSYDAWVLVQKLMSSKELLEYLEPYITINNINDVKI
jgi:hypothetical protein